MNHVLTAIVEPGFFASAPVHVALLIGGVVAVVSGIVGTFTVMRGQSYAGHALADISVTGGSGSFLIGISPLWGFAGTSVAAAGIMDLIGVQRPRGRDLATGIVRGAGLGLDGNRLGIPLPSRSRRKLVDEMLRAVDAEHIGNARVGNLSGGEQQRVLIAHALISRPALLLLDEPLANLDIASEQEVVALLARIAREQRIAVLISAHEMNPLLPVMDRIVYLAAGRAASGPTDEVVRGEVLSELYGHHVDVIHVHGRVLVVAGRGDGLDIPLEPAAPAAS